MLDIKFIEANAEMVRSDLKKRGEDDLLPLVDTVIADHTTLKALKKEGDTLRHSRNLITQKINELRKAGNDFKDQVAEAKALPAKIDEHDKKIDAVQARILETLQKLPNVLHESVPVGHSDEENVEVKKWGDAHTRDYDLKVHGELLEEHDLADFARATKTSGAGFYFLKGDMVLLEQALINFALGKLVAKGFVPLTVPLQLREEPYHAVIEMDAFENVMYKVEDSDTYLIATSEHPMASMYQNEVLDKKSLPIKYAGLSTCFRKEIGSHGVDTRGLFRVHQFNKVELFVFCEPKDSWTIHEELLAIAEDITQSLGLPYHVVNVCTGDIGAVAAKKYDIEAWFPRQKAYREIVSCSNCTDYQANTLNIRFEDGGEKKAVHTLNSTAIATSRIMAAIVENYQQKDGSIVVPEVLRAFVGKNVIAQKV